jgi:hypothetical protein
MVATKKPYCTILNPDICSKDGLSCNSNTDCATNAYCRKPWFQPWICRPDGTVRDIPTGEYCESNEQCESGLCDSYLCKARTPACTELDPNKCNNGQDECWGTNPDALCASNAYCREVAGQPNTCRLRGDIKNVPNDKYCDFNEQCESGLCDNYLCKARTPACPIVNPNACNGGKDECWGTNPDALCAADAYCSEIAGQPNTCRIRGDTKNVPTGSFCNFASQCKGGYCNWWTCSDTAEPCGFLNWGPCFEDIGYGMMIVVAFVLFWYLGIPLISLIGSNIPKK